MATRALQQVITYLAWNTSTNVYTTGDSANHSLSWCKDGTRSAATNAAAEVDSTNMPGLYKCTMTSTETDCIEGTLGGKSSTSNVVLIPTMVAFDYLNTSAPATAGVPDVNVKNYNNAAVSTAASGIPKVDIDTIKTNAVVNAGTITFPTTATLASTTNITAGTVTTATNLTNAPTAGDFTATMKTSIGTAVAASAVASVTGSVGSVTGLTASNLDTTVSSRMATYTQPTGFLAATFPSGTVANTTNITAGTITTATNLTNAPTAGDLTSTMKTSVETQVVTALATDTYAEPGQGTPASTVSLAAKIGYLYKAWRNLSTQTATTYNLTSASDNATVDQKATVSDDGTTFTRNNIVTGP